MYKKDKSYLRPFDSATSINREKSLKIDIKPLFFKFILISKSIILTRVVYVVRHYEKSRYFFIQAMSCTKPPHPPPPTPLSRNIILLFQIQKKNGEFERVAFSHFQGGGGVCKGHIKNCSEMMFPESKTVFKKTSHFMHKNRENGRKSL